MANLAIFFVTISAHKASKLIWEGKQAGLRPFVHNFLKLMELQKLFDIFYVLIPEFAADFAVADGFYLWFL